MVGTMRKAGSQRLLIFALTAACLGSLASTALSQTANRDETKNLLVVEVRTTCELIPDARCKGKYGFSISSNGEWTAGSGAGQSVVTGQTTKGELAHLRQFAADLRAGAANCEARPLSPPGVSETVIVKKGDEELVLRGAGGRLQPNCGAPASAAGRLFAFASQIMEKYYP